ncbi:MAG: hypothetical protein HDR71_08510 [Lachnospiraceae bacterium]|nr:hypothetical protein [Lachnospiraceae bacterium]
MKLKRQGFYKEMPYGDQSDPSILQFIRERGEIDEDKIYQYLEKGIVLMACGGIVKDIINPDNGIAGCPDILTDGIWVWPGDLAYYVKRYHLELDKNFIQTMRDNNWHIKDITNIDYDDWDIV